MQNNRNNTNSNNTTKLKKINALKAKKKHTINQNHIQHNQSQKTINRNPSSISSQTKKDTVTQFCKHFASKTELIYSPFKKQYYLPPSSKLHSCVQINRLRNSTIFKGQCKSMKIRPSSAKKYDYDQLYFLQQQKYKSPRSSNLFHNVQSKIKYLIDEDRTTYSHFHNPKAQKQQIKRQNHPDDDLSEQSSVSPENQ